MIDFVDILDSRSPAAISSLCPVPHVHSFLLRTKLNNLVFINSEMWMYEILCSARGYFSIDTVSFLSTLTHVGQVIIVWVNTK